MELPRNWAYYLGRETKEPYFLRLENFLAREKAEGRIVYPPDEQIFNAFRLTDFNDVKAVIVGQDPYHEAGEAMGLSFSVPSNVAVPPSLVNIYKELHADLGCPIPSSGDLTAWAKEGVLLLNSVLSVRARQAASHAGIGWERFTDKAISLLGRRDKPTAFILWGRYAQKKRSLINPKKHLIIESAHPSPLSANRGFFGSKPFSKVNDFLAKNGIPPINWEVICSGKDNA